MSDLDPIVFPRRRTHAAAAEAKRQPEGIFFDHRELSQILDIYGRKVAEGEWRDYAIGATGEKAVFSVFRRFADYPLYRIEKTPRLARRQGAYSVIAATGHIIGRGHDLGRVLRVLDKTRLRLVDA